MEKATKLPWKHCPILELEGQSSQQENLAFGECSYNALVVGFRKALAIKKHCGHSFDTELFDECLERTTSKLDSTLPFPRAI